MREIAILDNSNGEDLKRVTLKEEMKHNDGGTVHDIVKGLFKGEKHNHFSNWTLSDTLIKSGNREITIQNSTITPRLKKSVSLMLVQYVFHALVNDVHVNIGGCESTQAIFNFLTTPKLEFKQIWDRIWDVELKSALEMRKKSFMSFGVIQPSEFTNISDKYNEFLGKNRIDYTNNVFENNELANWIDKYKDFLEDCLRKYHMSKGKVSVFVRSRTIGTTPTDGFEFKREGNKKEIKWTGHEFAQFSGFFGGNKGEGPESNNTIIADELKEDIKGLLDGSSVVIFGFGDSGAGKTHTLMGGSVNNSYENGAIAIALSKLVNTTDTPPLVRIELTSVLVEGACILLGNDTTNFKMYGNIVELIGGNGRDDIMDKAPIFFTEPAQKNNDAPRLKLPQFDKLWDNTGEDPASSINKFITNISGKVEEYNKKRLRIRPTPNNPSSSRVHVYYHYSIYFTVQGSEKKSSLTIIDMAGKESPAQILDDFGEKLDNVLKYWRYQWTTNDIDFRTNVANKLCIVDGNNRKSPIEYQILSYFQIEDKNMKGKLSQLSDLLCLRGFFFTCVENIQKDGKQNKTYFSPTVDKKIGDLKTIFNNYTNTKTRLKYDTSYTKAYLKNKKAMSEDEVMTRMFHDYGPNSYLFFMYVHLAVTYFEGCYINYTLKQLERFFSVKSRQACNTESFDSDENDSNNNCTFKKSFGEVKGKTGKPGKLDDPKVKTTKHMLKALDDGTYITETKFNAICNPNSNTRYIMLAHIRRDREQGLIDTLNVANSISATNYQKK